MRPDHVNMRIDGVPVVVIDISTARGRLTVRMANDVDYSFDQIELGKWLKWAKGGGGQKP